MLKNDFEQNPSINPWNFLGKDVQQNFCQSLKERQKNREGG